MRAFAHRARALSEVPALAREGLSRLRREDSLKGFGKGGIDRREREAKPRLFEPLRDGSAPEKDGVGTSAKERTERKARRRQE